MAATKHPPPMTYTPGLVSVAKVFCRFRRSVEFAMCSCDGGRGAWIADCGFRTEDFGENLRGSLFNPQSAIRNPQSELPARVGPFKVPCAGYSLNSMHPVQKKAAWIPLIHAAQRELDPVIPIATVALPSPPEKVVAQMQREPGKLSSYQC